MACVGTIWEFPQSRMGWPFSQQSLIPSGAFQDQEISLTPPRLRAVTHSPLRYLTSLVATQALFFTRTTGITSRLSLVLPTRLPLSRDRFTSCLAMRGRALSARVTQ